MTSITNSTPLINGELSMRLPVFGLRNQLPSGIAQIIMRQLER